MSAAPGTVLRAMEHLEANGTIFTLEPEGRLGITPHPPADSPVLKFVARYKGNILAQLERRKEEANLLAVAQQTFGAKSKVIIDVPVAQMQGEVAEMLETELAHLPPAERLDAKLAILVEVIARFSVQGEVERAGWAFGLFETIT